MVKDKVVTVEELTPVHSKISHPKLVDKYFRYEYVFWTQGPFSKTKRSKSRKLVATDGVFYSGFRNRVLDYLEDKGIDHRWKDTPDYDVEACDDSNGWALPDVVYRPYQVTALEEMIPARRGVWKGPTGMGKTIIIAGLVNAFDYTCLVVVHTKEIFNQTVKVLQGFFGKDVVGRIGGGVYEPRDITVGMIQTLNNLYANKKVTNWSVVIVDECHHVNSFNGSYVKTLANILAPIRFGLTATLPKTEEGRMALEGVIGPVIGETTYEELQELEVLAKPIIKLYRVKPETDIFVQMAGGYKAVYDKAIVEYRGRNKLIVDVAMGLLGKGLTVLIMVERLQHGENILDIANIQAPGKFVFLHGNTADEIKEEEREAFESKDRKGVIATKIWSEGVNITSIGSIVNAVGGESEIATIQRFGRGMRRAEGKDAVYLIDIIDTHHRYFSKHSLKRICTYSEWGWL